MLVSVNGVRTPPEEARISVFDRGFLFGDQIYEVVGTHGRRPFHLDQHLDRLEQSGGAIGLDVASLRPALEREISELIELAPTGDELYIRIMISRGRSPDFDLYRCEGPPVWIVMVKPAAPWGRRLLEEGIRLVSVRSQAIVGRISPSVKSNNRQANVMAHRIAREQGKDDSLFVDPAGNVTEGPSWNVFCVQGGEASTPFLGRGILPGITRACILDLCREQGIPSHEREIPLEEVLAADEAFITSTTRGVMAVAELDDVRFAAPGPVTRRLQEAFRALTQRRDSGPRP